LVLKLATLYLLLHFCLFAVIIFCYFYDIN
jgi:hypothetical protein